MASARLTIFSAAAAPEQVAEWASSDDVAAIEAHPLYGARGRRYYAAVFGAERREASFAVLEHGRPMLIVPCAIGGAQLDHWGSPLRFFASGRLTPTAAVHAVSTAFDHLRTLA